MDIAVIISKLAELSKTDPEAAQAFLERNPQIQEQINNLEQARMEQEDPILGEVNTQIRLAGGADQFMSSALQKDRQRAELSRQRRFKKLNQPETKRRLIGGGGVLSKFLSGGLVGTLKD